MAKVAKKVTKKKVVKKVVKKAVKKVVKKKPSFYIELPPLVASRGNWTQMSAVEAEQVDWLWKPYIPLEEITNLIGMGSAGKSTLVSYIIGRVTTGKPFPFCPEPTPQGSVLIVVDEDSKHKGVKPKLEANCADASRVFYLDSVGTVGGGVEYFDMNNHCGIFNEVCEELQDVKLIVFDPITAYMGDTNCNSNSDVRQSLIHIQDVARRWKCAILGINHMNKDEEKSNANRGLGSVAFHNAARSELMVHRERNDQRKYTGRRLVGLNKGNLVPDENPYTLAYSIVDKGCVFEAEPEDRTIDSIMASEKFTKGRPKKDTTVGFEKWMQAKVETHGKVETKNVWAAADSHDVSKPQVYRVADKLGLNTNSRGNGGYWIKK